MALEITNLELAAAIVHNAAFIVLYLFVGFGPGFIVGILICNLIWGRGRPTLVQVHQENAMTAAEHNKQWHPTHPRWQK